MTAGPASAVRTRAVLLRSVDYGEADRIVTLLTEQLGMVAVMARSARKSTKRFAGALEPFGVIEAEVAPGRGEVGRLASARLVRGFTGILGSLAAMEQGGHALELVRAASPPREPEPRLFEAVVMLFEVLSAMPAHAAAARVAFELRALALLGLSPQLDACGRCGRAPDAAQSALFDPGVGAIVCRACGGGPVLLSASARRRMIACAGPGWSHGLEAWTDAEREAAREAVDGVVLRHVRATPRERGRDRMRS
jgi:DNA repair protein RecO (recombination protein O)